jgi:hypothetical protein
LLAACFTLHSINATLAIVPQRGAGLWIKGDLEEEYGNTNDIILLLLSCIIQYSGFCCIFTLLTHLKLKIFDDFYSLNKYP